MAAGRKCVTLEIVAEDTLAVQEGKPINGWGDRATRVDVVGAVSEIAVWHNETLAFTLRILDDGSLILNGHSDVYTQDVQHTIRLNNDRPWKD